MDINILKNLNALTFLSEIPSKSIDLVFADPPYIISRKTGFKSIGKRSVKRFAVSMDFGKWDNISIEEHNKLINAVIKESFRVLKEGGTFIFWYDLYKIESLKNMLERNGFSQIRFIEWIKTNPVPLNSKTNYLTNSREIALSAVKKGKPVFNSEYDNGVYSAPIHRDGGKRQHPCQKPLGITKQIIEKHTVKGSIVLDMFAGSGTTLCAAKMTQRKFMGCEIDIKYYRIALKRLEEI